MVGFNIVLVLHITFASVLFAVGLGTGGACRRAMAVGSQAFRAMAANAQRRATIAGMSGILVLITGFGLIFFRGGMGAVPPTIHAAMTLMLLAIGIGFGVVKPATVAIVKAGAGESIDVAAAEKGIKKLAMGSGIQHLLWLVMLGLMIFRG